MKRVWNPPQGELGKIRKKQKEKKGETPLPRGKMRRKERLSQGKGWRSGEKMGGKLVGGGIRERGDQVIHKPEVKKGE